MELVGAAELGAQRVEPPDWLTSEPVSLGAPSSSWSGDGPGSALVLW